MLLLTLLRLRVATQFGMTVDEAHYVLYGKLLDWSYFDHPPLVGWVQSMFHLLPLSPLLQARLAPILISLFTTKLIYHYLIAKQINEKNIVLSLAALNLTPIFNAMSVALLPDTLLMPLTVLIISSTEKVLEKSDYKNWLKLGLFLGLAALSKYTAILYVFALLIIFIYKKKYPEIMRPQLWLGAFLAFIMTLPIIYWNHHHDWASLKYQTDHVMTDQSEIFKNLISSLGIQMFSWGIAPFIFSIGAFYKMLTNFKKQKEFSVSLVFLGVFLLFFVYIAKNGALLPHWMIIFFTPMLPITYSFWLEKKKWIKTLLIGTLISALFSFAILFELGFKVFPIQNTASLYEGIAGWEEIIAKGNQYLNSINNTNKALAVMNWTLGSRALYYNHENSKVFVIDQRFDQFDIWTHQSPVGFDLVAIIEASKKDEHLAHLNCAQLTPLGEQKTLIKEVPVNHFLYYYCANFLGYK